MEKLKFYGVSDHALSLMGSYLSSRYQRVKLSDTFSTWQEMSRGVPQGSILGPILFNIFMNDLAYAIEQCRIVNYADETNIHCSGKDVRAVQNNLSIDLENATSWFIQNGMKPNPDKYQAMVVGKTEDKLKFKLANIDIKTTEKTCLLGVVLDNELKFDYYISSICRKVRKTFCQGIFIAHLYCRILTIVTKSGTTAKKETRESQRKGFEVHLQR